LNFIKSIKIRSYYFYLFLCSKSIINIFIFITINDYEWNTYKKNENLYLYLLLIFNIFNIFIKFYLNKVKNVNPEIIDKNNHLLTSYYPITIIIIYVSITPIH
jgi:hypothetical protein